MTDRKDEAPPGEDPPPSAPASESPKQQGAAEDETLVPSSGAALSAALGGAFVMALLGLGLIIIFGDRSALAFAASPKSFALGIFGAAIPIGSLYALTGAKIPALGRFVERQVDLFEKQGLAYGPLGIIVISGAAALSEEILFRGAVQTLLGGVLGPWPALIIASLLFGLAHAANLGYFLFTAALGLYLGGLFIVSGDLTAPVLAHFLYDLAAFRLTMQKLRARKIAP